LKKIKVTLKNSEITLQNFNKIEKFEAILKEFIVVFKEFEAISRNI